MRTPRGPLTVETVAGFTSPHNWALSPKRGQFAFALESGEADQLYRMPVTGGWPFRVTPQARRFGRPSWSPEGHRLTVVTGARCCA